MPLFDVRNVMHHFRGLAALADVSSSVDQESTHAIIGPNGAGKTSLLDCVSGVYRPQRGHIAFEGRDVTAAPPSERARLGIARTFQNIALFKGMTVLDNLLVGRHVHQAVGVLAGGLYGGAGQREEIAHRRRVEDLIDFLEIEHVRKQVVGALSFGLQQLRQALEFTQGVISAIPDPLFEVDRIGTFLNVWAHNPELLAARKEVLLGKTVSDVLAPDAAEVALSAIREADEQGMSFGKVLRIDRPQGERWFELSVSKKPGSDVPVRFIVLSRDITGRKQMEDDIRRRELGFRSLAENMPDNVIRYDRQARVQYMNPALMASAARDFLPVLGEAVTQTYPGNDGAASCERVVEQVIATGAPAEVEFQIPNLRGEMRLNQVRFVAERDGDGQIVGALGIGRDITERRASERQLRQALEFTQGVISAIPDPLFEVDRIGTCLNVWAHNPELLQAQKEVLLGKTVSDVLAPDAAEVALSAIREADEKGMSFGKVLRIDRPPGESWFELSVSKKPGSDVPCRFIVLSRDITGRKQMEDDVRRRELEFRSLAENMPDNVVRYDRQARVLYMNPAILANVAPDFLPVLGESPIETYPGRDGAAAHQRIVEQVIATGRPAEWEFQTRNPRGEVRIHHARYVAERDGNGEIVGVLSIGRDITERKRAELYEHFRSQTLELLSGGAPLQHVLEGIVRGVEQLKPDMICSILLLDSQGKRLGEGIAPSLPDFYNAAVDGLEIGVGVGCCGTAAATGERVIVDDIMKHPYWAPYKELTTEAGLGACWSEPILSSSGQVLGTFAVYHREPYSPTAFDISIIEKSTHLISIAIERKRAEEALRASEQEFRTLTENLPDPLVRYDREGRRTYVSPALERKFAVTAEQLIGKTLQDANPAGVPVAEPYQRALEHTLATGERSEFEMQMTPPGEGMRTYLCFMVAERAADGRIAGAIAVSRDITERKRSEAELERHRQHLEQMVEERTRALSIAKETAEAATRAKSRFLAAASHDLRQPISAIGLYSEALALSGLNEEQRSMSRSLTRSVKSLGEMLNELLDIAKLDAGKLVPRPAVIQSGELLETIASEFDSVVRAKQLSFTLHGPRRDLALVTDKNLLLTVLRNLIGNAVKYTRRGGILVGIRRRGNRALVQIWDTGIGIAPDQLDLIFEEYFQANNSERNRAKGAGLGLAIVKRVSEALGSRVKCRSRVGRGSVFEISLPLAEGTGEQGAPVQSRAANVVSASGRLAGKRIVVVEDDAMAAAALKMLLEAHGVQVTLFGAAEDALGSMEAMDADHYISDYHLGDMNGLQLLEAIEAKSAAPIKALLLTGNTSLDRGAIPQSSRWKVLFKPVAVPELLSALEL